jgi:hypothetical protein
MKNWTYAIVLLVMCACGNQKHDNAYCEPLPYDSTCAFNSKYMMVELQSLNYDSFVKAIPKK